MGDRLGTLGAVGFWSHLLPVFFVPQANCVRNVTAHPLVCRTGSIPEVKGVVTRAETQDRVSHSPNPVKRERYDFLRRASVTGRDRVGEKFSPEEADPVYTVIRVFFCRIIFPPPNQRRNPKNEA